METTMTRETATISRRAETRRAEDGIWEYRLLFLVCFTAILVIAGLCRLVPGMSGPYARRSIFEEARETAGAIVPFAFRA